MGVHVIFTRDGRWSGKSSVGLESEDDIIMVLEKEIVWNTGICLRHIEQR